MINHLQDLQVVSDGIHRMADRAQEFANLVAAYSADAECKHGNVPGTTPARCDCFTKAAA